MRALTGKITGSFRPFGAFWRFRASIYRNSSSALRANSLSAGTGNLIHESREINPSEQGVDRVGTGSRWWNSGAPERMTTPMRIKSTVTVIRVLDSRQGAISSTRSSPSARQDDLVL